MLKLQLRAAHTDDGPTLRAAKLGFAVCALLVVFSALAKSARSEPQLSVVSPPAQGPAAQAAAPQPPAAQPPAADTPAAQPPPAGAPDAGYQPGFIDAFGRFIGESAAQLDSQIKSTNEALSHLGSRTTDAAKDVAKDAVGVARDAGALIGLPNARIFTGRERCAAAANGAPDCRAAADTACRNKGFATGKSLDTQSTQSCPARVWLSGRPPQAGDCQTETFLTRAVCQ